MQHLKQRFTDKVYTTGIICIAFSLFFFALPWFVSPKEETSFGFFMFNFGLTVFYFIYRYVERRNVEREDKLHHIGLLLTLLFIGSWSLNRDMQLFDNSADWFSALLVILCTNYASVAFTDKFPSVRHLNSFINGIGLMAFSYLSLYLLPMYAIGFFGSILLGITLHIFAPLLFVIYTLFLQIRVAAPDNKYWISFAAGAIAVLTVITVYTFQWKEATRTINEATKTALSNSSGLPDWVAVSQKIDNDHFTQTVLKAPYLYSTADNAENSGFLGRSTRSRMEERSHDPLVMIATFFNKEIAMSEEMHTKVIHTTFNQHHESERRLWSDYNLTTDTVNTQVKLWPRCNLSYTEKTIVVANENIRGRNWSSQGEAVYTFYMPEGSVVTSLSLWVNGKEEKGILTTKELADSSYNTIVGRERRDPSVVHWREGNTVAVRVFPVIAGESRMFKIGITSPMQRINGSLRYEDIFFKGPSSADAKEELQVDFEQPVKDFKLPASFISKGTQTYKRSGDYIPGWTLEINDPGLAGCSFSFDGSEYSLSPYHKKLSPAPLSSIYLDINQSWIEDEFEQVITAAGGKNVFVFDNKITLLTAANKAALWEKLHRQSFSLFPLFEIKDREKSLLVTKNAPNAIRMEDLDGSKFMDRLKGFLAEENKINVFNLGDELPLYLRTLKEFRTLRYDNGDAATLAHHLQKSQFPDDIENDNRVVIHRTDMIIEKNPGAGFNTGPDHVMRLFSYNHIMQKLGKGLLLDRPIEDSLVKEAQQAYVVTPVSSLVVLETQADYDRFGITEGDDASLKNASIGSKGAVPEPHEWALIGLVAVVMFYTMRKRKLQAAA